jgi:hypothetical protein
MASTAQEVVEPADEGPAAGDDEVRRTPDWPDLGYVVRSRRPSSPVRLDPSTAGLREKKRLGNSFLA